MPSDSPPPAINTHAVDSSSLTSLGYDGGRMILQVQFRDRTVYQYIGVPWETYQDLCRANSKGQYFNHQIRNRFASAKLVITSP